jgi:hypothetical protein
MSQLSCRYCSLNNLIRVYDFGLAAPSRRFLTPELSTEPEPVEPLVLYRCEDCGLLQTLAPSFVDADDSSPATSRHLDVWIQHLRDEIRTRGFVTFDIPDVLALYESLLCDLVRHETFNYWTLGQLQQFLNEHGLSVHDVQNSTTMFGTLRVTVGIRTRTTPQFKEALAREVEAELDSPRTWEDFAFLVEQSRNLLNSELEDWQYRCRSMAAYTCSGYGMTTLNLCSACLRIPCLIDENAELHGYLTPGHRIPIVGVERLKHERFDLVVLLSPARPPIEKNPLHDYWCAGGRILVPTPKPHYLKPRELSAPLSAPPEVALFADFG